jgi:hypothetical protein
MFGFRSPIAALVPVAIESGLPRRGAQSKAGRRCGCRKSDVSGVRRARWWGPAGELPEVPAGDAQHRLPAACP